MLIFLGALGVACALRRALPDRARARASVRWAWMPVCAVLMQVALGVGALRALVGADRFGVVVASYVIVGAWLIANACSQARSLRLPAGLIAGGWLLNLIAIVSNRGMPVSAAALARLGVRRPNVRDGNLSKHVLATSHTVLPWLGDTIAVPVPLLRNVISVGDIVALVGVVLAVQLIGFTPRADRSVRPSDLAMQAANPR